MWFLTVKLSVTLLTVFEINLTCLTPPPKKKCCMLYFTNIGFQGECGDYQKCVFIHELIPNRFKIKS